MTPIMKKINTGGLKRIALYSGIAAVLGATPMSASAYNFKDSSGDVDFTVGGYVKLSAIYSDTDSGTIGGTSAGRTFYVPSTTPVDTTAGEGHKTLDLTARESRINFKSKTEQDGHKIGMTLEMDFLTTTEGNEVVSNSFAPRLRHFFFSVDKYLVGQTWSTFMDVGALPQAVDFLGASEGTVFIRQPQLRYTSGNLQIALENPENWITGATDRDVGGVPDIAANYKFNGDWGYVRVNGLVRQLSVDDAAVASSTTIKACTAPGVPDVSCLDANDTYNAITAAKNAVDETAAGFGIGLSGKIKLGASDNIKFAINVGDGMGRYTSVGLVKDAVVIAGKIETVESTAGFAAYHHAWNAKSSSNVIYSMVDIDTPAAGGTTTNSSSSSVQVNYLYSPVKSVTYGIMYLAAERETDPSTKGELSRIQATAKYAF
ncbi:MAG: DcaP family trimeric outer membrane transporter [Gammaproteobacteria bacterium]